MCEELNEDMEFDYFYKEKEVIKKPDWYDWMEWLAKNY